MAEFLAEKSGIRADLQKKLDDQYDEDLELEVREWVEYIMDSPFPPADPEYLEGMGSRKGASFYASLRDGSFVCMLLKKLNPNWKVPRSALMPKKMMFQQREAITLFLEGCKEYGVKSECLFVTEDLHSAGNLNMVLALFTALGSVEQGKPSHDPDGLKLGPAPPQADKQQREFSEEELAKGRATISLQMGTNQGASQSGMTPYGQARPVYDDRN